ncbi:MAG: flagellar export chaperone FliS [Phycisphaeraceae bacterium]|nr:flagellar export chaperone FliS [Phycisphaeraceae bacterium]
MTTTLPNQAMAYLRTKVLSASQEELRLMLLEGAVRFARQGREAIDGKDIEATVSGISQCRAIVGELLTSIRDDVDPELTDRVKSIYAFLFRELLELGVARDPLRLDKVIDVLEYERETWVMLMQRLAAERPRNGVAPPDAICLDA